MLRISIYILSALSLLACSGEIPHAELSDQSSKTQARLTSTMPADGVLGQLGFTATTSPILDAQSLDSPIALTNIGDHLLVADFGNQRITGYVADTDGNLSDTASLVLLQTDLNQRTFWAWTATYGLRLTS